MSEKTIEDNVVIVTTAIAIPMGTQQEDLLPGADPDVETPGGLRLVPASTSNPLLAIRQALRSALVRRGTSLGFGVAINVAHKPWLLSFLAEKEAEFKAALAALSADLPRIRAEWVEKNSEKLSGTMFDEAAFIARFKFDYVVYEVSKAQGEKSDSLFAATPGNILSEVALDVKSSLGLDAKTGTGLTRVSDKTRGVLTRVADKLDSLTLFDSRFAQAAAVIKAAVAGSEAEVKRVCALLAVKDIDGVLGRTNVAVAPGGVVFDVVQKPIAPQAQPVIETATDASIAPAVEPESEPEPVPESEPAAVEDEAQAEPVAAIYDGAQVRGGYASDF